MSFLLSLPYELLVQILHTWRFDTLLNQRLTCKTFANHATLFVFSFLRVRLEQKSLDNLLQISRSIHLRDHVKRLDLALLDFHDDVDFQDFLNYIYINNENGLAHRPDIIRSAQLGEQQLIQTMQNQPRVLQRAYKQYKKRCRQERKSKRSSDFTTLLEAALKSLPNLIEAGISDHSPVWSDKPRGGRQLRTLIRVLSGAGRQLECLSLRLDEYYVGTRGGLLSPLHSNVRQLAHIAFANLKKLSLELPELHHPEYEQQFEPRYSITTILQSANNLEYLELGLPDLKTGNPDSGATWYDLFGMKKVGRLQTLIIIGLVVQEYELINFISKSCSELREFRLAYARLIQGSWETIFNALRSLEHLNTVELHYLRHNLDRGDYWHMLNAIGGDKRLHDYLCKRTQENPWPKMIQEQYDAEEEDRRQRMNCFNHLGSIAVIDEGSWVETDNDDVSNDEAGTGSQSSHFTDAY